MVSDAPRRALLRALAAAFGGLFVSFPSLAASTLRVSAIPDESPTELQLKFAPLGAYLEERLGMPVEFVPVTDYAAVVEALASDRVDLAWLGGFTFIQAKLRTGGRAEPLVQRDEDAKFTSKFITASERIKGLGDLKGASFAFGSPSSTSGHLMPRHFLRQAGVEPERDLGRRRAGQRRGLVGEVGQFADQAHGAVVVGQAGQRREGLATAVGRARLAEHHHVDLVPARPRRRRCQQQGERAQRGPLKPPHGGARNGRTGS